MVVLRTYSAPGPFMRGRMNLIHNMFDDESNEFVKPGPSDVTAKVPRTRSYNLSSSRGADINRSVNQKTALPVVHRRGRLQKKHEESNEQTQQASLPHKRRKPRVQSGTAVQNIKTRLEFQSFKSRQTDFPVQIRDTSFRIMREKKLRDQ